VRSLRARVAFVVVLAFIPAFVVVYLVSRNDRTEARNDSADETRALAANVAEQYDQLVGDTRTLLRAIGSLPPSGAVLAQCDPALAAITRQTPTYSNLFVVRADGTVVCRAHPVAPTIDPEQSAWLIRALADGGFVGLDGENGTNAKTFTIAIALNGANGRFVVAAQIALDGLASVVGSMESSNNASITVVDGSNVILFQRPADLTVGRKVKDSGWFAELRRPGTRAVVVANGPDGVRRIYTGERLREPTGAVVLAGIPTKVAYAEPAHWLRVRVVALLLATLFALVIALAFAHISVIRRIRELVTMTRRIGAGDLTARSDARTSDEIGELGRSLDSMADELNAREDERAHLLGAIVEASEEERKRIAGDVHDDSIQVMSAHVMNLQLLRRRVDDPELQGRIRDLEESGRAATARLRDLVFELHSPTLEEHGLEAALETLLDRAFEGEAVICSVTSTLTEDPPMPTAATAYRIAQEAIRNARQHARASTITVQVGRDGTVAVGRDESELVMRVVDDGRGFDPYAIGDRPGHLGLRGMHERAAAVGGTVTIVAATGHGTTVECRMPWLVAD
jgi:signal transduction histidine kinase